MRRNVRSNIHAEDYPISHLPFHTTTLADSTSSSDYLKMNLTSSRDPANNNNNINNNNTHRFENVMEAKVEIGDTLQAIALRFQCTVPDIRRLNKIDKDNEIHARKVIKIPVTVHNVLLDNLPIVHNSGSNTPKTNKSRSNGSSGSNTGLNSIIRNPLEDADVMLREKLMVASVNLSVLDKSSTITSLQNESNVNSKLKTDSGDKSTDDDKEITSHDDVLAPLITDVLDDLTLPQLHRIRGPSFHAIDWSGSDCDMSWICLFVIILALCFVIPLVYVIYVAEHSHHNTTGATSSLHH